MHGLWWLPAASWAGLIFVLSATSDPARRAPSWILVHDKLVHASLFAILSLLICLAMRRAHSASWLRAATVGFVLSTLYGATDEIHQLFTPGRVPDLHDAAANAAGALLSFLFPLARRTRG